ncbi:MAG: choice-of-anchor B family protein [Flavobacteriales bacterium]|nr:choice-of-anchor B family protein [Flavobacteriales bacterium]
MRNLLSIAAFAVVATTSAQLNISLVGQLDHQALHNSDLSNIWGYTDETGIEYALIGVNGTGASNPGGISVVSLEDPSNPQEIFFFAGPTSIWREIKVWNDHAYMTTEAENGGIVIVDLSPLPQSTNLPAIAWTDPSWSTAHSLFIDENGRLYLHGANRGNGGVIMYDLTQDPMDPVEVGSYDPYYCHDSFARGDTLYAAHIYDGFFSIVDVSDPSAPVQLGVHATPNNFTHNTWLDASGNYLFTTDERTNAYVGAYDVSDPTDINEVDRLRSDNGSGAIPHNTYWLNDYVVTSYYTFGVVIYDASDPHNMVEVGNYDTSPFSGDGFNGAWGVYPFFDSGLLIISDIEGGLFVLGPTYVQACRLEGTVSNAQTSAPIAGATLTIVGTTISEQTPVDGTYMTGYYQAGTYSVQVSAPGYFPATVNGVVLQNGVTTQLDVDLEPMVAFAFQGNVVTAGTADPVAGAVISMSSPQFQLSAQAGPDGSFAFPAIFQDDYEITVGHWGWHTVCLPAQTLQSGNGPLTVELPLGYADDFALDLGWTNTSTASSGTWVRGEPVGTMNGAVQSNPDLDVTGDCGDQAYVTGNGGGGAGTDDVDDGAVVLRSPFFDATSGIEPHVHYYRWFYNGGGSGNPNDSFTIAISNGTSTVTMESITTATPPMSSWVASDKRIADFMIPSSTMQLIATATDANPGHVVEAALDRFMLSFQSTNGISERVATDLLVWPNPNDGSFRIQLPEGVHGTLEVVDATGRVVIQQRIRTAGIIDQGPGLSAGTYVVRILGTNGQQFQSTVVVLQ